MTLEDLIPDLPLSYAEGTTYGLVFAIDVKMRLDEIQQEHPPVNYATPVATADGRYILHGDLLSEVGPDGMFGGTFSYLDQSRFNEVEVLSWADAQALLPPRPEPI
jgi:hypothetical protein